MTFCTNVFPRLFADRLIGKKRARFDTGRAATRATSLARFRLLLVQKREAQTPTTPVQRPLLWPHLCPAPPVVLLGATPTRDQDAHIVNFYARPLLPSS